MLQAVTAFVLPPRDPALLCDDGDWSGPPDAFAATRCGDVALRSVRRNLTSPFRIQLGPLPDSDLQAELGDPDIVQRFAGTRGAARRSTVLHN
jgi:hypothetical protein